MSEKKEGWGAGFLMVEHDINGSRVQLKTELGHTVVVQPKVEVLIDLSGSGST